MVLVFLFAFAFQRHYLIGTRGAFRADRRGNKHMQVPPSGPCSGRLRAVASRNSHSLALRGEKMQLPHVWTALGVAGPLRAAVHAGSDARRRFAPGLGPTRRVPARSARISSESAPAYTRLSLARAAKRNSPWPGKMRALTRRMPLMSCEPGYA